MIAGSAPRRRVLALVAAVALAHAVPAAGESLEWHVAVDNDYLNFWQRPDDRPDFGYTHGTEIGLDLARAPRGLARLAPGWLAGTESALGPSRLEVRARQSIYAPWRLPPDRPYAGWLEAALGIRRQNALARREAIVHLGTTGPPSFADRTQRWIHRQFGDPPPDWSHELPAEVGFGFEANGASRSFELGPKDHLQWLGGPMWRARLATYAVDLRVGLQTGIGIDPARPWGAPPARMHGVAAYLIANAYVDLIARDFALDGTLFRPSAGVSAAPVVPEAETGIGLRAYRMRLEWRIHRRAKEYDAQPEPHTFSSLIFTWNPGGS